MNRPIALAILIAAVLAVSAAPAGAGYSGSFDPATSEVTLTGDGSSDKLTIKRDAAGRILFDVGDDGTPDSLTPNFTPTVANVAKIAIHAQGGDDSVVANEASGALPKFSVDAGPGADAVTGGSGGDSIIGGDGDDTLLGKGGFDTLNGAGDNDAITPGDADDTVIGGAGDDVSIWNPGDDTDVVEGGPDRDRQIVNGGNSPEAFDIAPSGARVRIDRLNPAPFTLDTDDVEAATIHANGGDDTIVGHTGLAGQIALTLEGGQGTDRIQGGDGDDVFEWTTGHTLTFDGIDGGGGNDRLNLHGDDSSENYDVLRDADVTGVLRNQTQPTTMLHLETIALAAGPGDDTVKAADNVTTGLDLDLGDGHDVAVGGTASDRFAGGPGDDILRGLSGDDTIAGDAGTDLVDGGDGADQLSCGGFGDQLITDAADTIAADCKEAPSAPAEPGAPPVQPQTPAGLPAGFRGFSRPRVSASLKTLSVTVTNTHSAPITVTVGATESRSRYRGARKTIAPGAKATIKLKTPSKLRKALARKLKRSAKVARRPRISIANTATGGKSTVTARVTLRRR